MFIFKSIFGITCNIFRLFIININIPIIIIGSSSSNSTVSQQDLKQVMVKVEH